MALGDQVAPEAVVAPLIRLNEFTVGLVIAHSASALCRTPPMNWYATLDSPSSPSGSRKALLSPAASQADTCTWQPFPDRCANGLGMNVARSPCRSASVLTM